MSILRAIPFLLLSIPLLLNPVLGVDPLYHICSTSNNYTSNSLYGKNLQQLMASLSTKVPLTGFGLRSVGRSQDRANGLALCRGDTSSADCKTCINGATSDILQLCPYNEQAIIWYDHCLLRYSNIHFFGQIDTSNKFYLWNLREKFSTRRSKRAANSTDNRLTSGLYGGYLHVHFLLLSTEKEDRTYG
ncbi:hypothetical protein MRB53_021302 [Persea americana]|uniref:Uncharacterized protein n=1 Tax=Persea americana TaxID=3435 RepID=A0ACC2L409_PERAE|nr:hypothetical protein MRB53_021302 [Persea americana]